MAILLFQFNYAVLSFGILFVNSFFLSVSRMLEKICREPQILVDIFVNYDCDLEAPNLFERTVWSWVIYSNFKYFIWSQTCWFVLILSSLLFYVGNHFI